MRVLYVIDTLAIGGAEISTLEIARRFKSVSPMVCFLGGSEALRTDFEQAGIPVVSLDSMPGYQFAKSAWRLSRLIRRVRPDVVHALLFRAEIATRLACGRKPNIGSFVNDSYSDVRFRSLSHIGRLKVRVFQTIDRLTARAATRFISISDTIARSNAAALGIDRSRISVIYRGRDPSRFTPIFGGERKALRREFDWRQEDRVVLNVARLLGRKGQADLLRALPMVTEVVPSVRLCLAGDGPDRSMLETLARELEVTHKVRFLGSRDDIPSLLAAADVFAFPSHYEGHGGALVEAMLAGCPVVASDTSVHRESVEHNETALLHTPGDSDAIAKALVRLLTSTDEAVRLGNKARGQAIERFDIRVVAQQHELFYQEVLEEFYAKRANVR